MKCIVSTNFVRIAVVLAKQNHKPGVAPRIPYQILHITDAMSMRNGLRYQASSQATTTTTTTAENGVCKWGELGVWVVL